MRVENFKYHPVCYDICIAPDLDEFTFTGRVDILLEAFVPVDRIELNILELSVSGCRCVMSGTEKRCRFTEDLESETLYIDLPEKLKGDIRLSIDYTGIINDSMAGFYRSRHVHDGKTYMIAVTQFQESDARRAFPSMDHPGFKARFNLAIEIFDHLSAIANTPIKEEKPLPGGKKMVVFTTTPVMSTYLLFFGIGPFEIIADDQDPRVRAAVLPGMEKQIRYGLTFARKALAFCESYYKVPYPLPKLDLIAVPDFAFGAMENWGAITFRENLLLYDPAMTSVDSEERICDVIAHEIVHQWFGNLVTPADWKYIWLNESFATYFGYCVVAYYHPDWGLWNEFLRLEAGSALERDGLSGTIAMEIPKGKNVVINSSTAPIIYRKGAAVLRQIEGYIGRDTFASGLCRYLETHAYSCTQSRDIWAAMEECSGKPVTEIMEAWVCTPGHPLVSVRRQDNRLIFEQERFSYTEKEADPDSVIWPIPLLIGLYDDFGNKKQLIRILDKKQMSVDIDPEVSAYKVNDAQTGFFRVFYDDSENMGRLAGMIRAGLLPVEDRWGIENDLYAMALSGRVSISQYLDFLDHYSEESGSLPLSSILAHLMDLELILTGNIQDRVCEHIRRFLAATLDLVGYEPEKGEAHDVSRLRNGIFWPAVRFGIADARDAVLTAADRLVSGRSVHPDIFSGILQAAASICDNRVFEWLFDRMDKTESEFERIDILRALGCVSEPERIKRVQAYIMEKVPDRNKYIPATQLCRNPVALGSMWGWYAANSQDLASVHPLIRERIILYVVSFAGLYAPDEVRAHFNERLREKDEVSDVIRMSLKLLEVNLRLRQTVLRDGKG